MAALGQGQLYKFSVKEICGEHAQGHSSQGDSLSLNFFYFLNFIYLFCICGCLSESMFEYYVHSWYPQRTEEGVSFRGSGITVSGVADGC